MQAEKQPEILTEDDFARAEKRPYKQKLSKEDLQHLKEACVGQPVWEQTLSLEELQAGGFGCWGEYVAWALMKAW